MSKVPPPVLGFNNNVRHRGRIFHIQTEDSGVKNPRIVTHLFADGGRIIKTARIDYTEHVGGVDLAQRVRKLMKAQHKAMFGALRAGHLDQLLEAACGPLPLPPEPAAPPASAAEAPLSEAEPAPEAEPTRPSSASAAEHPGSQRKRALSNPNLRKMLPSVPPPTAEALDRAVSALDATRTPAPAALRSTKPESSRPRKSNPASGRKLRAPLAVEASERPPLGRPASRYGSVPSTTARSIFGDGVISEKSLDEVILSYLAEDLDGSSE